MQEKKQNVTIKGRQNGLTLLINDLCSFDEALAELKQVVESSRPNREDPIVSVNVELGNRYLTEKQKEQLKQIIHEGNRLAIDTIESNVITREEALKWKEESQVKAIHRIVRSGQVLEVTGDLLLIGDVNPGGMVVSTGDVYIMGNLRGTAHAGANGDRQAVIAAAYMKPSQLRIADYISRAPDYETTGVYMECGFISEKEDKIVIDRLQVLSHLRKDLSSFERRMQNG